jgi:ubiquinol-cytochrome c reductase cytochrome c subunit
MSALSRRRIGNLLAWFAVIAGAVALTVAWGSDDVRAQESSPVGDVDLGGQLYAQACAQCHASDGGGAVVPGTNREAPALTDRPQVTAAYVDLVMRTGRMPPAANPFDNQPREVEFDDEERLAIVAYVVDEFGIDNDLGQVTDLPEGNASVGQNVYATNCAACHGSTGAGGVAGGGAWTPEVNVYDATTIAEAIRVGPFQMPAFGADQITDQEAADVAAFLEEVSAEPGTPIGLTELNPVFASGFVALLAVAMILSLFWISSKPTWFPDPDQEPDEEEADPTGAPSLQSVDTEHNP